MYDRDNLSPMDENTPIRPTSGKGQIRAEIAQLLMTAAESGDIEALIAQRKEARAAKDFNKADAIRDELAEAGVVIEDGPSGTTWRRGG